MNSNMRLLALLAVAVGALGQTVCPEAEGRAYRGQDGCCVCNPGYKNSTVAGAQPCSECAEGYILDPKTGMCSNGRKGSHCKTELQFPYFGCTGPTGKRYGTCSDGDKFPCVCKDGDCGAVIAKEEGNGGCFPKGPRMFTTFPNEPTVDKKFSLTLIGCDVKETDEYLVIPAYTDDAMTNMTRCEVMGSKEKEIGAECRFTANDDPVVALGNGEGGNGTVCKLGFHLSGWSENKKGAQAQGMSEMTYSPITFTDSGRRVEAETYFKLCKRADDGSGTWQEVANHNAVVDKRDETFKVARGGAVRGAAGGDGDGCCEGLKIGSLCLPLWAFLLLWLLMALCLGVLGYTLHKNKNEIEAKKNNQKYEKFDVDAEMNDIAARQDEDDDI